MARAMRRPKTDRRLARVVGQALGAAQLGNRLGEALGGVLAQALDHRREEGLLGGKVAVNGPFGDTGGGGDLADGDRGVAFRFGEKLEGRVDQAFLGFPAAVEDGRGQGVAVALQEVGQDRP